MPGKLFLAGKPLSLGTACRLCRICLLHGESKLARGCGCRRLFQPGGDALHLRISGVAGEASLLVGADCYLHQAIEELLHDIICRLLPGGDDSMRVALRHHCTDAVERGVVAQQNDTPR